MAGRSRAGFAVAFMTVSLVAGRAWAPPLCSYGEKIGGEILTLTVRLATVDGVQVDLAGTHGGAAPHYSLRSGCEPAALDGVLADPDAAGGTRAVTWTLAAPQP